ncbi:hypothetical protein SNE26_28215 [Mucilaginibacter sp. cycad4]|uniref:hypothetical protein n=1 Tax=Mucilaginibacter sp. cycad4 TaxID=3342096 RepID=UPI002AAAF5B7|nr:hypothetical protein [Mucilaginibacter gossypii]WPU99898.1 hypothetical protein SNE26_28215 [Mucilaginibacter gossypii]
MKSNELIGTWKLDETNLEALEIYGNTSMEFKDNGELLYTVNEGDKKQHVFMTYEVQGNKLLTDQPSSPKQETTQFAIVDNRLELYFDGVKSVFIRI